MPETPEIIPRKKRYVLLICTLTVLLFISSASAFYYYEQYASLKSNSSTASDAQTQTMLTKLGKLIVLPSNETPSIAKVVNKNKLTSQPFFANAKDGDWLIIYQKAREAIIYRESINKVIAVGPVTTTGQTSAGTASLGTQ